MKSFPLFLAILFFNQVAQATEVEIVEDIISMHQQDARRYFGREISLRVFETNEKPNAHASYKAPNNGPLLTYYSTLLMDQRDDEVVAVVCHELGHFLGARFRGQQNPYFAIESESDYFGGQCAFKYYRSKRGLSTSEAQTAVANAALSTFQSLYKIRINPNAAKNTPYKGINPSYSKPDCRVLTFIHGSLGWKRPACWFNPNS